MLTFDALTQELQALPVVNGITPLEILVLPEVLQSAVRKMFKRPLSAGELSAEISMPIAEARVIGDLLVEKGYLRRVQNGDEASVRYSVALARMRTHNIPSDL